MPHAHCIARRLEQLTDEPNLPEKRKWDYSDGRIVGLTLAISNAMTAEPSFPLCQLFITTAFISR